MKIKKILILGSTLLTELVVDRLSEEYELVGYVPSKNPTKVGSINLPEVCIDQPCDIKLSIQYDLIVKDFNNCFNLHTGMLPHYGGCNILDYTLKNKETEQGLTIHKMTNKVDYGPIISKITYPVLNGDTVASLYKRILAIAPDFVLGSLNLLKDMSSEEINRCNKITPTMYKRGEFFPTSELMEI
jgi:hypothetical protein